MHVGGVHEVTTPPPVPAQPPAPWGYNGGHGDTTPVQVHGHGQGQGQGSIPQPCLHGQDETLTVERLLLPRRIELPEEWRERLGHRLHEAEETTVSMVAPANRVKARCLFGKVKQDVMQLMQQLHDLVNSFVDSSQDVLDDAVTKYETEAEINRRSLQHMQEKVSQLEELVAQQRHDVESAVLQARAAEGAKEDAISAKNDALKSMSQLSAKAERQQPPPNETLSRRSSNPSRTRTSSTGSTGSRRKSSIDPLVAAHHPAVKTNEHHKRDQSGSSPQSVFDRLTAVKAKPVRSVAKPPKAKPHPRRHSAPVGSGGNDIHIRPASPRSPSFSANEARADGWTARGPVYPEALREVTSIEPPTPPLPPPPSPPPPPPSSFMRDVVPVREVHPYAEVGYEGVGYVAPSAGDLSYGVSTESNYSENNGGELQGAGVGIGNTTPAIRSLSSDRGRVYQHMLERIRSMYRQG